MDTAAVVIASTSSIAALLAVWVAYLTLYKTSEPQILAYYELNSDLPTIINLVIENIGGGIATNINFSTPLPIHCFGVYASEDEGITAASSFPALSPKQRYTFNGGQFGGLKSKVGGGLRTTVSYDFKNPIGWSCKRKEAIILSIEHLTHMPTKTSANQAIVDALKSSNKTTVHEIRDELKAINRHLAKLSSQHSEHDTNGTKS